MINPKWVKMLEYPKTQQENPPVIAKWRKIQYCVAVSLSRCFAYPAAAWEVVLHVLQSAKHCTCGVWEFVSCLCYNQGLQTKSGQLIQILQTDRNWAVCETSETLTMRLHWMNIPHISTRYVADPGFPCYVPRKTFKSSQDVGEAKQ